MSDTPSIAQPRKDDATEVLQPVPDAERQIAAAYRTILRCIGEDPTRAGLLDTPKRASKAMLAMTAGYKVDPRDHARDALFDVDPHGAPSTSPLGMVVVRDIQIHSLCEHHLLPFYGVVHLGYLPGRSVVGLSKVARIADAIARRLQMQERLTQQLCDALMDVTDARGVVVVVECSHLCMCARGVKQIGAMTLTSATRGAFATDPALLSEFHGLLGMGSQGGARMQPMQCMPIGPPASRL